MIDSHAHLTAFDPDEQRDIIKRARARGVTRMLAPATGKSDLRGVIELCQLFPGVIDGAVGCHPHEAKDLDDVLKKLIQRGAGEEGIVAIGEIGLDYHYDFSPREDQRAAFTWQLALAKQAGLPVILHQREAWDDFLAIIDRVGEVRGIAHSFTEGAMGVAELARRGLFVGISGMVTFPKSDNIRAAVRSTLPNRLLIETDSPYLAPVPHRGKPNEPAFVTLVAAEIARIRGVSVENVEQETDQAYASLFLTKAR